MARSTHLRIVLAIAVFLGMLLLLGLVLGATRSALALWEQLQAAPLWVSVPIIAFSAALLLFALWLVWRILRPARPVRQPGRSVPTEQELQAQLDAAAAAGIDVEDAARELRELAQRRELEAVHLALFGEISSGKSSLINALLPGADVETGVVGGTTTELTQYRWLRPSGDTVILIDVPGLNQVGRDYDAAVMEEAQRAHVVIFVCEGDLTRDEQVALEPLLALGKPLVIALNKTDRYSDSDLEQILQRFRERLADHPQVRIAPIATRPVRTITRIDADGNEQETTETLPAQIDPLRSAIQSALDGNLELLVHLRDSAVFDLAARKLESARAEHRREASADIVRTYTRRAVAGGLAAISPGTDIIIQGYLGTRMVQSLCELYEVPVREIDLQKTLSLTTEQARTALPLLLAVIGNAAKAFPGIGTLAGGLAHAVAYGLIFDALGRAVARTLESRGELRAAPASVMFRDNLADNVESQARKLLRLALDVRDEQRHEQ